MKVVIKSIINKGLIDKAVMAPAANPPHIPSQSRSCPVM